MLANWTDRVSNEGELWKLQPHLQSTWLSERRLP
jgi:hypothetical protein